MSDRVVPEAIRWEGVARTTTCANCSKRLCKIYDGTDDVKFVCVNALCGRQGWGFCQLGSGIYVDGYYPAALDQVRKQQF